MPETANLMHAFTQNCHDPDVFIWEMTPMDKMVPVPKEEAVDSKFGGNGPRNDIMGFDLLECFEHAGDVTVGLLCLPSVPCVAIDVIEAQ